MTQRRSLAASRAAVLLAAAVLATGCLGPVRVKKVDPLKGQRAESQSPISTKSLSEPTLQTLRLLDLDWRLEESPASIVAMLNGLAGLTQSRHLLSAEAEIALELGRRLVVGAPEEAAGWFLIAASRSYEFLFDPGSSLGEAAFDPRFQEVKGFYEEAVGDYLAYLEDSGEGFGDHRRDTFLEPFRIELLASPRTVDPLACRNLVVADQLRIRGLRNHYERGGFGVPLVAVRDNKGLLPDEEFLPPMGVASPVTAVLSFDWPISSYAVDAGPAGAAKPRGATLAFYDPRAVEVLSLEDRLVPLAADFTSHFAYQASLSDLSRVAIRGLLQPILAEERGGLYLREPYNPNQIPVVMVHGLKSSPLAWMELTNDLFGDPELRDTYQVWHYLYPTGLPYLYSGMVLRRTMETVRSVLDPEGDDPAMNGMVFVAHSMGGLLTRTLVTDSGTALWDAAFLVPPKEAVGPPEDLEWLEEMFFFTPASWIDRVIFIAVPHRGSASAQSLMGKLGSSMVVLPGDLDDRVKRLVEANPGRITPEMEPVLQKGVPGSIRALRPDHPVLLAFAEIPIEPGIPFHTIVGNRGRPDAEEISDGWVTYESSRLEGAASERVVPSGHNAYTHPQTISEIKRILKRHLRSVGVEVEPDLEPDAEPWALPLTP